ncbi:MAG: hypothetical protein FWF06_03615 [Symbiobacteriaceae bacterium]|nr:hypothetical protein [Symbiobacteriaceae bacterium]
MATLLTPVIAGSPSFPSATLKGGTLAKKSGDYFFYSNYPEQITAEHIADSSKKVFLNSANVSGDVHVYAWHQNMIEAQGYGALHITNRGSTNLKIEVLNSGLTNNVFQDTSAWSTYFGSRKAESYFVDPGYSIQLFRQTVLHMKPYGYIAHLRITGGSARLQDVFYTSFPDDPINQAQRTQAYEEDCFRGSCSGYIYDLTTPVITVNSSNIVDFICFGKKNDGSYVHNSFGNNDMADMNSGGPSNTGGKLSGCFGQILRFKMRIKNGYASNSGEKSFKISLCGRGGNTHMLVGLTTATHTFTDPQTVKTLSDITTHTFYDFIKTDPISPGTTSEVTFFTVVPAGSNGPYALSAHY